MLTQHKLTRLWMAGLVCLVATSASAQERTAEYGSRDQTNGQVRPVNWGTGGNVPMNYSDPYVNYAPGYNVYPNYPAPHRGYVAYGHTGRACSNPWFPRWSNCGNDGPAFRANLGRRVRCSMAWLRPLTYWDVGGQTDIIALNPGYAHPSDLNQGYAAQGYGGPISIPQAPNVRSNYNYSWGLPSSRLTPTSVPYGY